MAKTPKGLSARQRVAVNEERPIHPLYAYLYVADREEGLVVATAATLLDGNPANNFLERAATFNPGGALNGARKVVIAGRHAYVAAGRQGLAIVDVERPEEPRLDQLFDAGGAMDDVHDVKVGMTNASLFAYVADGRNGLRVIQLVSANATPGAFGFSPRATPSLIATYRTRRPALAISKGLDRARAVDESGNQIAVFGRRGACPFTLDEMRRLFIRDGKVWIVDDAPVR